jgi:hypothetical protein
MISRSLRSATFGFVRPCSSAAVSHTPAPLSESEAANTFNNIMFKGRKVSKLLIHSIVFLN